MVAPARYGAAMNEEQTAATKTRATDRNPWLAWLAIAGTLMTLVGLLLTASADVDRRALGATLLTGGIAVFALWAVAGAVCWQIVWRHERTISPGAARK